MKAAALTVPKQEPSTQPQNKREDLLAKAKELERLAQELKGKAKENSEEAEDGVETKKRALPAESQQPDGKKNPKQTHQHQQQRRWVQI